MEQQQQDVFIDADSWQGGKQERITFKDIVLMQVRKISQNANVEFRGGYWETKEIPFAGGNATITNKIYIPDTREVYSNSIEYLFDLLFPHADDELKKAGEKADEELAEAKKKYTIEHTRTDETPEERDRVFVDVKQRRFFRDVRTEILRKLFREISCFLKRVDYFEGKSFADKIK